MRGKLKDALNNIDMMYTELVEIANKIIDIYTKDVDELINKAYENVENLTMDNIRTLITKLSMKSYMFGDVKEKSSLKADCAEILKKEAYAIEFNKADGNNAIKENTATLEISDEIVSNAIYDLVASLFKTKLDEIHRVTDSLKSVLVSRMQEMKLSSSTFEG